VPGIDETLPLVAGKFGDPDLMASMRVRQIAACGLELAGTRLISIGQGADALKAVAAGDAG